MATIGAPLTGILTDYVFGFKKEEKSCNHENARALGYGLFVVMASFWFISFLLYGLLHYTYPTDLQRIQRFKPQKL